jgi:sn-glycerol 3-phosphate transport system substrate-binding protein
MRRSRGAFLIVGALVTAAACGGSAGSGGDGSGGGEDRAAELPECPVDALEDAEGTVDVTLWHSSVAKPEETLNALADEYNASQDRVEVHVENQGTSFEELQRKYNQAIASDDLPDIAVLEDTQTQALADSGTILPAQSCIDAEDYDLSDFVPTLIDFYSIEGDLYPASMTPSNALLYFNRNHFEDAGLDPADPPQNLDEMRAAAEAIQDAGITERPFVWHMTPWQVEFWLTGAGIPLVDNDNGRGGEAATAAAFNNEDALALFEWLNDMYDDGLMLPVTNTPGQIDHYLAIGTQRASFSVEASSAATSVEAFLKGDLDASDLSEDGRVNADVDLAGLDIAAAEFPGIEEPGHIAVGGGVYYMMNTAPPEVQAAAWDFLKFVNTPESQVQSNLEGGADPIRLSTAELPEVRDTWENTLSGQWLAISFDQQQNGIDPEFPGPLLGPYTELRDALRTAVERMILEDVDPQQALDEAEAEVNEAIARYEDENF